MTDTTTTVVAPSAGYRPARPDAARERHLHPYYARSRTYGDANLEVPAIGSGGAIPQGFQPWWEGHLADQLRPNASARLSVDVDRLVVGALKHAPQVQALKIDPHVEYRRVIEEDAAFDWRAFVDTEWNDISEPVGSALTTGATTNTVPDPRFRDHRLSGKAGLRRRTRTGGELEISQQLGIQSNNSIFLVPPLPGTTRLALNYSQPLLRGSGKFYNQSRICLAQLNTGMANDDLMEDVQNHLVDVTRAYWDLYTARAIHLQKRKLLDRATRILEILEARRGVDSLQRQVLRARAAVASRRTEIARAIMDVRNAESQLRRLVNDPILVSAAQVELTPVEFPSNACVPTDLQSNVQIGLQNRPDISRAFREIRAASVRLGVAEKDLLPKLDLIFEAYAAGLERAHRVNEAFANQFTKGEPSYTIGLQYEYPLGNRAARAARERRQLEVNRALFEFRSTVELGITEVELAVREAETSYREIISRYHAMMASETEAVYLNERWRVLGGDDRSTTLLLEDLLDAQERVADEERDFVAAQANYLMALIAVKQASGTLFSAAHGIPFRPITPMDQTTPQPAPAPSTDTEVPGRPQPEVPRIPGRTTEPPTTVPDVPDLDDPAPPARPDASSEFRTTTRSTRLPLTVPPLPGAEAGRAL